VNAVTASFETIIAQTSAKNSTTVTHFHCSAGATQQCLFDKK